MKKPLILTIAFILSLTACVSTPDIKTRIDASRASADALRAGRFAEAMALSDAVITKDAGNPFALLVRAVGRYVLAARKQSADARLALDQGRKNGSLDIDYFRKSALRADAELSLVEADLEKASSSKEVFLDLSPALWEFDWDQDGNINDSDRALLEIEQDEQGNEIPKDDPRRRPVFRFDQGDVHWARAFVNFQRALINIILAYDWEPVNTLKDQSFSKSLVIEIKLIDKGRIFKARALALRGLDCADSARLAYLAETDDEREWVPNPRQKSHPMPLPVTEELYKTWEGVVADLRKLVRGDEVLSLADVAQLANIKLSGRYPKGSLDIGAMFSRPKDISLNIPALSTFETSNDIEGFMKELIGEYYVYGRKTSLLTARIRRMKEEVNAGIEPLGRKLRYLLWLN